MSYEDQHAIYEDFTFRGRLEAAVTKESRSRSGDMASAILRYPLTGTELFLPWVTTEPGFDVADQRQITDGMLLAAIQAVWAPVEASYVPPAA